MANSDEERKWNQVVRKNYIFSDSSSDDMDTEEENPSKDSEKENRQIELSQVKTELLALPESSRSNESRTKPLASTSNQSRRTTHGSKKRKSLERNTSLEVPKKIKIKNEDVPKSKVVKKECRAFLGITWTMIHPSNSTENVRWKKNDPERFLILNSQKIKIGEWQEIHGKPNLTVSTLRNRLRTYFRETEMDKNGYEYSPLREKLYYMEFREAVPFGNGEIFDTGVDRARKQQLRAKSTNDLMDMILDHEQKIVEQQQELDEMKGNLEEKILVHQAGLESLNDLHRTEINQMKEANKKCRCLNEHKSKVGWSQATQTDSSLQPGPQIPSSTDNPTFSLLDGIEYIAATALPLTEKGQNYLSKDFGDGSDIPLHEWPQLIDEWLDENRLGNLSFRDAKFIRKLHKEGMKRLQDISS